MGVLCHEHRLAGRCFWRTRGPELQIVELWYVVVVVVVVVEGLAALVDVCLSCPCLAGGHGVAVAVVSYWVRVLHVRMHLRCDGVLGFSYMICMPVSDVLVDVVEVVVLAVVVELVITSR